MEYSWIGVKEGMPPEHDSIFKPIKGTNMWNGDIMFESISDEVLVSIKFADGTRRTYPAHTTDGVWRNLPHFGSPCVTHWTPMPEYKE